MLICELDHLFEVPELHQELVLAINGATYTMFGTFVDQNLPIFKLFHIDLLGFHYFDQTSNLYISDYILSEPTFITTSFTNPKSYDYTISQILYFISFFPNWSCTNMRPPFASAFLHLVPSTH